MNRFIPITIGIAIAVALAHPATAKKNNPNVSLEFTPQQAVAAAVANVAGAMLDKPVALHFEDDRQGEDPKSIGIRTDDKDRRHNLVATSDVPEFVEQILVETAKNWGIRFDDDAGLELDVHLLQFNLLETNQAVGATYNATVRLEYALRAGDAEPRVRSTVVGDATRYGRKFSNTNCNEVLSDAMLEAFAEMFSDPALQRAWGQ